MTLRFIPYLGAAVLALAACEPVPQSPITPLPANSPQAHALMPMDTQWDVLTLNGERLDPGVATIGIFGPEPVAIGSNSAGYNACNGASGFAFAPLGLPGEPTGGVSTLMACAPDLMAMDEALAAALSAAEAIGPGAAPGTVDLIGDGQRLMTVRRKTPEN